MPLWVSFLKARSFANVKNKFKTTGKFTRDVRTEAFGSAVWARRRSSATESQGPADWEVDVQAIPTVVPVLTAGGAKVS